uniref:Ovule protein n=1 Tax=Caenorhabditis tropicalis TaxID=1561998 RepID=A0A1I7UUP4_9PELO
MIGNKTFRSEEEQLLSLLDETQGPYPLLGSQDPVIFFNPRYEKDLFMEYNYDFGGESPCSSLQQEIKEEEPMFMKEEAKLEPSWLLSPSESEDQTASPSPYVQQAKPSKMQPIKLTQTSSFNPYCSGPLIKEPCKSRSRGNSNQIVYRSEVTKFPP